MILSFFKKIIRNQIGIPNYERRNLKARKFKKREYSSLGSYLDKRELETELSTIWFSGIPFDVVFQFKDYSLPLVVFFHGRVDQERTIIPHFVGLSYANGLAANTIHLSDPSLIYNSRLTAAWFLGCPKIDMQHILKKMILGLAGLIGTEKIVIFGSSGGGYPALYLSQVIPQSLVIVNSPATSILNHPRRYSMVSDYLSMVYGAKSEKEENKILAESYSDFHHNFNLKKGKIIYLLNINDMANIEEHVIPFFQQFVHNFDFKTVHVSKYSNLSLLTGNWGEGHRYPPPDLLKKILTLAVDERFEFLGNQFDQELKALVDL